MLLSKSCIYGLRASLYLASQKSEGYTPIRKMSEDLEISFHFLTKIMQQLTADELLESFKGPNGGVRLKKSGDEITFMDIVMAIDGPALFTECALGLPGCGVEKPCPFHEQWAETRDNIKEMMEGTTINELAIKGKEENLRLTAKGGFEKFLQLE
ncbi:RrF2 family transcriptional regulator [Rhodohalobacter halophilus]|uniref:RrF2 family transcriptional regulator n=1 Tax=Rhodohalobacter halophilus TaxID=1812810 RepID=UPI0015B72713|nr:Rrf2 family transcriptional regulator [Rhodohalobacter halophilus]